MLKLDAVAYTHPGQNQSYAFTLEALPGEVTAITGPSGSGKSTLLDLITGFLKPIGGTMTLDGTDLLPLPPERRPVSILFQSEMLFDHLPAGTNVALGLPRDVRNDAATRISAALDEVGLRGVENQRASTLSGGQKQRVALARTLLRNKPILLLDEPFSALDDDTRTATRALVRDLTVSRNWHTILVSHHTDDVDALAARRYHIVDGMLRRIA
jgi:thiamine transport system ATP-binding protein